MTPAVGERVALVTGAARGLGRAIAEALAQQGVSLMLVDVLADRLSETRDWLEARGARCGAFATDISERANCVAAVGCDDGSLWTAGYSRQRRGLDAFQPRHRCSRRRVLAHHARERCGAVLAFPSRHSAAAENRRKYRQRTFPKRVDGHFLYRLQLTKSLAVEYADGPIRINAVAPGAMMTEIGSEVKMPDGIDYAKLKRYSGSRPPAAPAEVAEVVALISSPLASSVHGAVWTADGGVTAG